MKELTEEKACICTLNRIFGYKPQIAIALIEYYGSAAAVFDYDICKLQSESGIQKKYIDKINRYEVEKSYRELDKYSGTDIDFIGITDNCYPPLLKECCDPPLGLYIKGTSIPEDILNFDKSLAFVGTRDITPYGKEWCIRIIDAISRTDARPTIVSGLAMGIDGTAHQAALDCGLPTLAVMATGINDIYPSRHIRLAEKIISTDSCGLVSDYPPNTPPEALNFIRRNRIIAGLSNAVILIESKVKGGGMITARQAFSYDREVFALQGRINDIHSGGCNQLIYQKIAEPIISIEELLKRLGFGGNRQKAAVLSAEELIANKAFESIDTGIRKKLTDILEIIKNSEGIVKDEIAAAARLPYNELSYMLTLLESKGIISIDILQRCSLNHRLL